MSIKNMQQRLTQVGVIRLGEKRTASSGKEYPAKLETFRITSPSRDLVERAAALYGGEVRDWPAGPSGPEFQVTTKTAELPVYVLPQRIDPNLELWGNRHRVRFCDGETERIRGVACLCEQAARQRYARTGRPWPEDGRFIRDPRVDCKPTTRLSVMLADLSDGQWKVEAHGWNAAAELPTKATVYLALAQKAVPAILRLKVRKDAVLRIQQDGSEKVESREYVVPELDFGDLFTARQALTGGINQAIERALQGRERLALESGPATPAEASRGEKLTPAQVVKLAGLAKNVAQVQALWKDANRDGVLTDEVKSVLEGRAAELKPQPAQQVKPTSAPPAAPADEPLAADDEPPVEGEVEPDTDELWTQIMAAAGKKKWNSNALEQRITGRFNKSSSDINGWEMEQFLAEVKSGAIA